MDLLYSFYAEAGEKYQIRFANYYSEDGSIEVTLRESDLAGWYQGLEYSVYPYYGEEEYDTALRIIGCNESSWSSSTDITIPSEINGMPVKRIDDYALRGGGYTSITVGEGIEELGNAPFAGCESLQTLSLPSTLRQTLGNPISGCLSVTAILFPNGSDRYITEYSGLIDQEERTFLAYFGPRGNLGFRLMGNIRFIGSDAFSGAAPMNVRFPVTLREVSHMPTSIIEMHFENKNCIIGVGGIPPGTSEEPMTVYAPAGGTIEAYCLEHGINFVEEGEYNPDSIYPMKYNVSLPDEQGNNYVGMRFDAGLADYQDYQYRAQSGGLFAVNFRMGSIGFLGSGTASDLFDYQFTDGDHNPVTPLWMEDTVEGEDTPVCLFQKNPSMYYRLRLLVTEEAITARAHGDLQAFLVEPEVIQADTDGWEGMLESYHVDGRSHLLKFTVDKDAQYTVKMMPGLNSYGNATPRMMLYRIDGDGSAQLMADEADTFQTDLESGTDYYLFLVEQGSGQNDIWVRVLSPDYIDPHEEHDHVPGTPVKNDSTYESPTCDRDGGYSTDIYCTICGDWMSSRWVVIPALGHKPEKVEAVAPTTESEGNIEYYRCTVCGKCYPSADCSSWEELSDAEIILPKVKPDSGGSSVTPSGDKEGSADDKTAATEKARKETLDKKLPKVSISKPAALKKGLTVKWKKLSKKNQKKVDKIEIWICPNKKFTARDTIITTAKKNAKSLKVKKLKARTTYYVKVRTIKTVKGVKTVSSWSKPKKIKTK